MAELSLDGCRILVVEDDYLLASDLERALEDAGARVVGPAPSLAKASASIEHSRNIDVAVLDVNLGGEAVYPLADRLASLGIPFVFTTGYDAHAIPRRFATEPRLEKPIDAAELVRVVTRLAEADLPRLQIATEW